MNRHEKRAEKKLNRNLIFIDHGRLLERDQNYGQPVVYEAGKDGGKSSHVVPAVRHDAMPLPGWYIPAQTVARTVVALHDGIIFQFDRHRHLGER